MTAIDRAITGGTVIDGTGAPGRRADVAITGDRIAAIAAPGELASARETIDAAGHVVCPGFIDIMSHSLWAVMGEGYSPAPQGGAIELGGPWSEGMIPDGWIDRIRSWTRFGDWLEAMERRGLSPNVASFLGGHNLRGVAAGMDNRPITDDELDRLRALVDEEMADGEVGIGTGLMYE